MPKAKTAKASLGDVATLAGVSKGTASLVLRNSPGPSEATRQRVLRAARKIRYAPDARLVARMEGVAFAKSKELLPIAWLNSNGLAGAWHVYEFMSPFFQGASEYCLRLGYRLEEIWTRQPGMTMRRIAGVLYQRGIQGVIVSHPARHIRLRWDCLAGVSLGGSLLAPRLNRVTGDVHFNLFLALKMLKRHGYQRVGICLAKQVDQFTSHILRTSADHIYLTTPKANRIPPLFYPGESHEMFAATSKAVTVWMRRYRPQVVIGGSSHLLHWASAAGFRVPDEIGVVHLSLDDDVLDWAGIHSNKREQGRVAAAQVINLLRERRFGIPLVASDTVVRGNWQYGRTLGKSASA